MDTEKPIETARAFEGRLTARLTGPLIDEMKYDAHEFLKEEPLRQEVFFTNLLARIYSEGGSPDIVFTTPELAYERGVITYWEYTWFRLRRKIRRFLGLLKLKGNSGAPSAPRTHGSAKTENR